ncbi:MAG: DUF2769 domain-containing protein [Candidatus Absconditabacterales bacterium]
MFTTAQQKIAFKECICKTCPSFKECSSKTGKEKIAYCIGIKSKCIKEKQGCICGGCPVYKKLNLEGGYFCIE